MKQPYSRRRSGNPEESQATKTRGYPEEPQERDGHGNGAEEARGNPGETGTDLRWRIIVARLGEERCRSIEQTRERVGKMGIIEDAYMEKVGQRAPEEPLARTLWRAVDEHTL